MHLYYPRDISAIRSAYGEQSIFSEGFGYRYVESSTYGSPTSNTSRTYSARAIRIEPFSGQGMALTQEAQLCGIVNSLRSHAIRFVVLRCTDSLDYPFPDSRFLHRANPEAFIVGILGSNMLFAREIDSTEFRGVVALTTFPLLPRGQDWTQQNASLPQHAHRVFEVSDIMEGVYLAARFLTTDNRSGKSACSDIPNYRFKQKQPTLHR